MDLAADGACGTVQCKMRGPENQAGHKGTAGAGPGVASRSQCIPLLAAAMEAAFKGAGVAAHVNLRDPKVHHPPYRPVLWSGLSPCNVPCSLIQPASISPSS